MLAEALSASIASAAATPAAASSARPAASAPASSTSGGSSSSLSSADLSRSLLNFRFEPTTLQTTRFVSRPKTFPKGRAPTVFNKNAYLQANHFFTLGQEDAASFLLPDQPVDWAKVELVVCPVDGAARDCPICLAPAVAAKITKCGHVFCA